MLPAFLGREAIPFPIQRKFYFKLINLLSDLRVNDFSKFNIPFSEALFLTQRKNLTVYPLEKWAGFFLIKMCLGTLNNTISKLYCAADLHQQDLRVSLSCFLFVKILAWFLRDGVPYNWL